MPTYTYRARDSVGKLVKGVMAAPSKTELAGKLEKMGYLTTEVAETLPEIKIRSLGEWFQGVSHEDLIIFNVQLSNLINAGIPLLTSLSTVARQIENKRLRKIVQEVSRSVEGGESLSEALTRHPRIFSKLFVSLVRAGEASGKLDAILTMFAVYSEQQAELKQKISGALFYPLILLVAGILLTLFIVTSIIPQFVLIFMKTGIRLPLPTLLLYQIGTTIQRFWLSLILFVAITGLELNM